MVERITLSPIRFFTSDAIVAPWLVYIVICFLLISGHACWLMIKRVPEVTFFFLGFFFLLLALINDFLYNHLIIESVFVTQLVFVTQFALFFFIAAQSLLLSKRFSNAFNQLKKKTRDLVLKSEVNEAVIQFLGTPKIYREQIEKLIHQKDQIHYAKKDGHFLNAQMIDKTSMRLKMNFADLLTLLPEYTMRIHKSYVINPNYFHESDFQKRRGKIYLTIDKEIGIHDFYYKSFIQNKKILKSEKSSKRSTH